MNLTFAKAADRYGGTLVCYALAGLRMLREMIAPRDSLVEVRTILLVKFWGLGNIVLLLPVIRALRKRYPDARIVFVSLARNRELLEVCPELDERIYVDDGNLFKLGASLTAAAYRINRERPDLTVDFEQFARTSVILATLASCPVIVGLATPGHGRNVLYHKPVHYDDHQHMAQTYLDLARAAGVLERLYRPARVPYAQTHSDAVDRLLADAGTVAAGAPLAVLHPGSGDNFQGRRWPAESFAELARRLVSDFDATVLVTGTGAERALVEQVCELAARPERVLNAAGRLSALGLAALVDRADLLMTNDTAPVHFGSAQGTPVFAFFGPNTPRLYGPLSRGSYAFYRAIPCSPCLTNQNYKTSLCRMPVCITEIGVDEVFDRIGGHLAERRAGGALEADDEARSDDGVRVRAS